MKKVSIEEWKKAIEGIMRKDIGPFVQNNSFDGVHSFREYLEGETVVMRLTTHDHGKPCDCPQQTFEVEEELLGKVAYIFIPTQNQLDEWDEPENGTDSVQEAAKIDSGWLK